MTTAGGVDPVRAIAVILLGFALAVVVGIYIFEACTPDEVDEELAHTDLDAEYVELLEEEDAL